MDDVDYELYIPAELNYDNASLGDLPINWYNSKDYKLLCEIIAEALEKNINVEQTDLYKQACLMNKFD